MEVTIAAMTRGEEAPISFAELMEVTESTFAIEEAIRTGKMVTIDA
jgi:hypothetical protein